MSQDKLKKWTANFFDNIDNSQQLQVGSAKTFDVVLDYGSVFSGNTCFDQGSPHTISIKNRISPVFRRKLR